MKRITEKLMTLTRSCLPQILAADFAVLLFFGGAYEHALWLHRFCAAAGVLLCGLVLGSIISAPSAEENKDASVFLRVLSAAALLTAVCMLPMLAGAAAGHSFTFFHKTFVFGVEYTAGGRLALSMLGLKSRNIAWLAVFFFAAGFYLHKTDSAFHRLPVFLGAEGIFAAAAILSGSFRLWAGLLLAALFAILLKNAERLQWIAPAIGLAQLLLAPEIFTEGLSGPVLFLLLLTVGCALGGLPAAGGKGQKKRLIAAPAAGLLLLPALLLAVGTDGPKLPQKTQSPPAEIPYSADSPIGTAPGVSLEMLSAESWKSESGGSLLMSAEEIRDWNEANKNKIATNCGNLALRELPDSLQKAAVKGLVTAYEIPANPKAYFVNGSATTAAYWKALIENAAADSIPGQVPVRFGYSVVRSTLQQLPSRDAAVQGKDLLFDKMVRSDFPPFAPLAVVHESADGAWYFVIMYGYAGWIEKDAVALCGSREEWLAWQDSENFLIVSGSELRLADEPYQPEISGLLLPMGTRLLLAEEGELSGTVNARANYGCYTVKLPVRDGEGRLKAAYTLIPKNAAVHEGYLPYTEDALLELAFGQLGARYGWAGDFNAFDCSGFTRAVYSCFGFDLPRTSAAQVGVNKSLCGSFSGMSEQDRRTLLASLPPGTLLYFPGHIMLYLGCKDGEPYAISAVSTMCLWNGQEDRLSGVLDVNTVCVTSLTQSYRASGYSWLNALSDYAVLR